MIYLLTSMNKDCIHFDIIFASYEEKERDAEYERLNPEDNGFIRKDEIAYDKALQQCNDKLTPLDRLVLACPPPIEYCSECGLRSNKCECDSTCCSPGKVCRKCKDYPRGEQ